MNQSKPSTNNNQLTREGLQNTNKCNKYWISTHLLSRFSYKWQCRIIRTFGVGITCFISSLKPNFSIFSSLVGSIIITIIGFFFPCLIYYQMNKLIISTNMKYTLLLICAIGIVSMVVGSYQSIQEIV